MTSTDSAMTDAATNQRAIITLCTPYEGCLTEYSQVVTVLLEIKLGLLPSWCNVFLVYHWEEKMDIMTGNSMFFAHWELHVLCSTVS